MKISAEQIKSALVQEVLKREVVEGEKADEARKKVGKASVKSLRTRPTKAVVGTQAKSTNDANEEAEPEEKGDEVGDSE